MTAASDSYTHLTALDKPAESMSQVLHINEGGGDKMQVR